MKKLITFLALLMTFGIAAADTYQVRISSVYTQYYDTTMDGTHYQGYYVRLLPSDGLYDFRFFINGITDMTDGTTYSYATDMEADLSWGADYNLYEYVYYSSASLTRNSGYYSGTVTSDAGNVYNFYQPQPISSPIDTIAVTVSDGELANYVTSNSSFRFSGTSSNGYTASCGFQNVSSLTGSHPSSEIGDISLYDNGSNQIAFNNMIGDAMVTQNGYIYNLTMNYVGTDSVLYQIDITADNTPDTTYVTATSVSGYDYTDYYGFYYLVLTSSDYNFNFPIVDVTDITTWVTYTYTDMDDSYTYIRDRNEGENIYYTSCSLTKNSYGDYNATVTDVEGNVYYVTYLVPRPITQPKDTIAVTISNGEMWDCVKSNGHFSVEGTSDTGGYYTYFEIQNATSLTGTYSTSDVSNKYWSCNGEEIAFSNMLGDATMTKSGYVYTFEMNYVGTDSVLYQISISVDKTPDTVDVVATSYDAEYYSWENLYYVNLSWQNGCFQFGINGVTELVDSTVYNQAQMSGDYFGSNYYTGDVTYQSCTLMRNSYGDYIATVTDQYGNIYNVTYLAPRPVYEPIDTVLITVSSDINNIRMVDNVASAGTFRFYGNNDGGYGYVDICFKNATSMLGNHPQSEFDVNSTRIYDNNWHRVQFRNLIGDATVTLDSAGVYTLFMNYVGLDSVLYQITVQFHYPRVDSIIYITANDLDINMDYWLDYKQYEGYGVFSAQCSDADYILQATVNTTNSWYEGTYTNGDSVSVRIYDASTYDELYSGYTPNLTFSTTGNTTSLTGTVICWGDVQLTINATGTAVAPDTTYVTVTSIVSQYEPSYRGYYVNLESSDYYFSYFLDFETSMTDSTTYTYSQMNSGYSYGIDYNEWDYIPYASCTLMRNSYGDYFSTVTSLYGDVYIIKYEVIRPVTEPIDTIQVIVSSNTSQIRLIDQVATNGLFQFYGPSDDGNYTAYCAFQNVTQLVGNHPESEIYSDYTSLYYNGGNIRFRNMLGDATVAQDSAGAYTFTMNYVGMDSVLYQITIMYHNPVPTTVDTITATDLSVNMDDWRSDRLFTVMCSDSSHIFYAQIYSSNSWYEGSYNANDVNYAEIYDPVTYDLLYRGYVPNLTLSTVGNTTTLTGTLLCYGDVQFVINATGEAVTPDTVYVAATDLSSQYYSDEGGYYVYLGASGYDFRYFVNSVSDLAVGTTYTLSQMNSRYSWGYDGNEGYNIRYASCTLMKDSMGDYHSTVQATDGYVFIITYEALRPVYNPVDTVQVMVSSDASQIRLIDQVASEGYFEFRGPSDDNNYWVNATFYSSAIVGTHPASEIYADWTNVWDNSSTDQTCIDFRNMLGDANVTLNGGVYTLTMDFVGMDSVLYQITIQYHTPTATTTDTISATNLYIGMDDWRRYKSDGYGYGQFTAQCDDGNYLLAATVNTANTWYNGTYTSRDSVSATIYDASTYDVLYNGYAPNLTFTTAGNTTTLTGTVTCYGDVQFVINATGSALYPDTTNIVATSVTEGYNSSENGYRVNMQSNDGWFSFMVNNVQNLVVGRNYNYSQMNANYCYGYDYNEGYDLYYASCTLKRVNSYGDYEATVQATDGYVYNITYTAPRPLSEYTDTVQITISDNINSINLLDYVTASGVFQFVGLSNDSAYYLSAAFQNVTSLVGNHPQSELYTDYTALNKYVGGNSYSVPFRNMAGDATVTLNGGVYTFTMNYVSTDSVLYQISLQYHEPYPATVYNITSNNLVIYNTSIEEDGMFYVQCSDSNYLFYADVQANGTSYNGSYGTADMTTYIYDASTRALLYNGYTSSISITTVGGVSTLTGTMLCKGDVQFNINATGAAVEPESNIKDTAYVVISDSNYSTRLVDVVASAGMFQVYGCSDNGAYYVSMAIQNANSVAGTYGWDNLMSRFTGLYKINGSDTAYVGLESLAGDIVVTESNGQYTFHIDYVGVDSTLYIVDIAYHTPVGTTEYSITATDLEIDDNYLASKGVFTAQCSEGGYLFFTKVYTANSSYEGRYDNRDSVFAWILDPTTNEVLYEGYAPDFTITTTDSAVVLKGSLICYTDVKFVISAVKAIDPTGVEETEFSVCQAYAEGNTIVLNGAEGQQVMLYDMAGRLISSEKAMSDNVRYEVNAAGVYVLRVNDETLRVVVK